MCSGASFYLSDMAAVACKWVPKVAELKTPLAVLPSSPPLVALLRPRALSLTRQTRFFLRDIESSLLLFISPVIMSLLYYFVFCYPHIPSASL